MAAVATLEDGAVGGPAVARLQQQVEERDEIIVALQHAILDLRHEIENLRSERAYATFALSR